MHISDEQFRLPSEHNIHIFLPNANTGEVTSVVTRTARDLKYHLATLQGTELHNERELLVSLAKLYNFPKYSGENYEGLSWNGASDWLGDLTWLTGLPRGSQRIVGFILLYLEPMILFTEDPVGFATFLDVVGSESHQHIKEGIPFHIVMGPVDPRAATFINRLRISPYVTYLS